MRPEICWRPTGTASDLLARISYSIMAGSLCGGGLCTCSCWAGRWGINGLKSLWMLRGRANRLYLPPSLSLCDKVCPEGVCHVTIDPLERLLPWLQDALMNGWMSPAHLASVGSEGGRKGRSRRLVQTQQSGLRWRTVLSTSPVQIWF